VVAVSLGFVAGDEAPMEGVSPECKRDFPVIVRQQNLPDGVYLALCPMLPAAIGQGNSRAEALQEITKDIQKCLEEGDQPIQVDFVTVPHPPKPPASA
jgi:predicted RNase H-like HicB family nuclease